LDHTGHLSAPIVDLAIEKRELLFREASDVKDINDIDRIALGKNVSN
jgi:hypothetical protein